MKPTPAPLSIPGSALLGSSPYISASWGEGAFLLNYYWTRIPLDASQAAALKATLNRVFHEPLQVGIQPIITKIRAMQDSSATQCNPAGPERARFDALTDVIVMLEGLEEGQ